MPERLKVLIVGQTPPPYHGQAIMIDRLLRGKFAQVQLFHVRMAFSDNVSEIGRFRVGKLLHLASVIAQMVYHRCIHRTTILCYPPAGPNRVPLYRDLAILMSTRWMFRRTILYFHAGGVSELYPKLSRSLQWLFRRALFNADAAIRISAGSPDDAGALKAWHTYIVPNGIEDEFERFSQQSVASECMEIASAVSRINVHLVSNQRRASNSVAENATHSGTVLLDEPGVSEQPPLRILFVGILSESKGLMVLIEACRLLAEREIAFELQIVGQFNSSEFQQQVRHRIRDLQLEPQIQFLGMLQGDDKWRSFVQADVLCLPTFYESETFGMVLVEAMSFRLPVVATRWRGIPEIVDDAKTGFLVDIHDPAAVADRLARLHTDPALRREMGDQGRKKFLTEFTAECYWQRMEKVFIATAKSSA
jgi:glycosyltransferase involved in cell wall biosynthesis